jgi:hypothetical protein
MADAALRDVRFAMIGMYKEDMGFAARVLALAGALRRLAGRGVSG